MSWLRTRIGLVLGLAILSTTAPLSAAEPISVTFTPPAGAGATERQIQDMPKLGAPALDKPIAIDGIVDAIEWGTAPKFTPMLKGMTGAEFRVAHDGKRIYVAVTCDNPPQRALKAEKAEYNQGSPWRDDCAELWLTVLQNGETKKYQFIVNPVSTRTALAPGDDSMAHNQSIKSGTWQAAAKQNEKNWSVEYAISPEAIGLTQLPAALLFNVGRNGPTPLGPISWGERYGAAGVGLLSLAGVKAQAATENSAALGALNRTTSAISTIGQSLQVVMDRPSLRPSERWIEGEVRLRPQVDLKQTRVRIDLYGMSDKPVSTTEATPTLATGRFAIDMRSLNQPAGQLVVSLLENGKVTGVARAPVWTEGQADAVASGFRVPLKLDVAPQVKQVSAAPIRFGVPFPQGALWDAKTVRLVNGQGKVVPAQVEVAGYWARDGAIKWLTFDAQVSSDSEYFVEFTPAADATGGLTLKQDGDRITIDTGAAKYVLGKGSSPIQELQVGGKRVASSEKARGLFVIDQAGRVGAATAEGETMTVESAGPIAACVRFEGDYKTADGKALARHITRVETFAGKTHAKITHTLVLINDSNEIWFKDIGWELAAPTSGGGNNATALFNINREQPAEVVTQKLGGDVASAHMFQDSHYRFTAGNNHCVVNAVNAAGAAKPVQEGVECGDWAALTHSAGGLFIACREAARQHPKEFEIFPDRIVLHLFSNRAGEELDFRSSTLIQKWNLKEWAAGSVLIKNQDLGQTLENTMENAAKLPSNAIGWGKTHELLLAPLPAEQPAQAAAQLSAPLTYPTYLHVDPQWIYRTQAFGPLHPQDVARYPQAEALVRETIKAYDFRDTKTGLYGIMDYGTGPIPFGSMRGAEYADPERYRFNYFYRRDVLLMAARSADRYIRDTAERITRSVRDVSFTHWDSPRRVKGGFLSPGGADHTIATHLGLPYWWEATTSFDPAASSEPEDIMYLYYLTGDRRAKEVANEYFAALKKDWTPASVRQQFFVLRYFAQFILAYEFTMDPEFAEIVRTTLDMLDDPEARLGPNQWIYFESYKVQQDLQYLIKGCEIFGDPRLQRWVNARQEYLFSTRLGWLDRYQGAQGRVEAFAYRQDPQPFLAEHSALLLREIGFHLTYDGKINNYRDVVHAAARCGVIFTGLAYSQDILERSNADKVAQASWVTAKFHPAPEGQPSTPDNAIGCIYVLKPVNQPVTIRINGSGFPSRGEVRLNYEKPDVWNLDLNRIVAFSETTDGQVEIAKFSPAGTYQITGTAEQIAFANSRVPMVLYAPGLWTPYPDQNPWVPIYFNVPSGAQNATIEFEGTAVLTDAAGQKLNEGNPVTGKINLPSDKPGLWSFIPVVNKKIKVTNVPPFFAFRDPTFHFEPKLPEKK